MCNSKFISSNLFAVFACLLTMTSVFAQERREIRNGIDQIPAMEAAVEIPAEINFSNFYISEKRDLKSYILPIVTLSNVVTRPLSNIPIAKDIQLADQFVAKAYLAKERKQPLVYINIPAFIKKSNGQIEQLISYELTVQEQTAAPTALRGKRVYAASSVLSNGTWHKIALPKNNIYKIDFDFVKTKMGIDPSTIVPSNISIYGYGGGMVPENNFTDRPDDLVENAIQLVGMNDGKFDAGDFIVFYGQGPDAIIADTATKSLKHQINLYTTRSNYFVNFNKPGGKRVTDNNISLTPNLSINTYEDLFYYENDSSNIGFGGKAWLGEMFGNRSGALSTRTFNFQIPDLDFSKPVNIEARVASTSTAAISRFGITMNGNFLGQQILPIIGTQFYDSFFTDNSFKSAALLNSENVNVQLQYSNIDEYGLGFLDFIELNVRRKLRYVAGSPIFFRSFQSVGSGNIAEYAITTTSTPIVWDISNPQAPVALSIKTIAGGLSIVATANQLKEFACFAVADAAVPDYVGKVSNQNLHGMGSAQYIVVTHPDFLNQANELAAHHAAKKNYKTAVATTEQIYNEFASGKQDIAAIRDFIKMFYDRAATVADLPIDVLLLGDASYDYKNRIKNIGNFVPSREPDQSKYKLNVYVCDDFFGMLDDEEDINQAIPNTMDIGVGRFPVGTAEKAAAIVNKVKIYESSRSFGPWKNNVTFCADNKDLFGPVHMSDAEVMAKVVADSMKQLNAYKIYVDAFPIFSLAGGNRAPQAKIALDAQIFNGTLAVNYNGHGGPLAWCEERIFTVTDIANYNNINKLPLFITATCDFAPFNQQAESAGEKLLTYAKGGAIGLMTTTQLVFQSENIVINRDFWKSAFQENALGKSITFGETIRNAKNRTYIGALNENQASNFRKFTLLGDPAVSFNLPTLKVAIDSINGKALTDPTKDTLKALNVYKLNGSITDENGNLLPNFNGTAFVSIFDKIKKLKTLESNITNPNLNYFLQNDIVFNGKTTVKNGKFAVQFIVPKDINYDYGFSKISLYANSADQEASGLEQRIVIGGAGNNNIVDNEGPEIKPFINSRNFLNGGLTGPNSTLLVDLYDTNGINTSGTSVGHDITAILDNNIQEPITLNTFFEGANNDYKRGTVTYPLRNLSEGPHTLTIKAWDALNNSNTVKIDFVVGNSTESDIKNVLNYPNPFTTSTEFWFEHNHPGELLYVTVKVFSVAGNIVRTIQQQVNSESSQVREIKWDGKDQLGNKIGKGTYLYQIHYKTASGSSAQKIEKLVIL